MIQRYRDIQLLEKDDHKWLAVACDVSAGIGDKERDVVKVSPQTAGYYATAVPIIELLAIGAEPISVSDTLGVQMAGTGEAIIQGVKKAMKEGHVQEDCLTGSTEDNIPTVATSIGITVIAELSKVMLKSSVPLAGEDLYLVGLPKMGQQFLKEEVIEERGEVIDIATVRLVRAMNGISHMLPVGSKGIECEINVLLNTYGLSLNRSSDIGVDLTVSAGPATCMIVACDQVGAMAMKEGLKQPVNRLGMLV